MSLVLLPGQFLQVRLHKVKNGSVITLLEKIRFLSEVNEDIQKIAKFTTISKVIVRLHNLVYVYYQQKNFFANVHDLPF